MPTYEYECAKCGRTFDYLQTMSDPVLKRCILDGCKGKVQRLISAGSGIIFKGSGFYETDYKKKSGVPDDKSKQKPSEESKSSGKGKSSTESKSTGKSESTGESGSGGGESSKSDKATEPESKD